MQIEFADQDKSVRIVMVATNGDKRERNLDKDGQGQARLEQGALSIIRVYFNPMQDNSPFSRCPLNSRGEVEIQGFPLIFEGQQCY